MNTIGTKFKHIHQLQATHTSNGTITITDRLIRTIIIIGLITIIIITITIRTDQFMIPIKTLNHSSLRLQTVTRFPKDLETKKVRLETGLLITDINTSIIIIIIITKVYQRLFLVFHGMEKNPVNRRNGLLLIRLRTIRLSMEDLIIHLIEVMLMWIKAKSSHLTGRSMGEIVLNSLSRDLIKRSSQTFTLMVTLSRQWMTIRDSMYKLWRIGQAGNQCQQEIGLILAVGVNTVQDRCQIRIRIDVGIKVIFNSFFLQTLCDVGWLTDTVARKSICMLTIENFYDYTSYVIQHFFLNSSPTRYIVDILYIFVYYRFVHLYTLKFPINP